MKNNRNLVIGISLLIIGVIGLSALSGMRLVMGGMMGGGAMMIDRTSMKEMMKNMMGTKLPPGINPENLPDPHSAGSQLFAQYCTQCHELPSPGLHTAEEWPLVIDRMNRRVRMMGDMMHNIRVPTNNELQALVAYLQRHAQKPLDKTKYPDLNTHAGKSFEVICSQCHVLPDPKQHTANEWPDVVERMTQNMKTMGKPIPDQETLKTVVKFLQTHAK